MSDPETIEAIRALAKRAVVEAAEAAALVGRAGAALELARANLAHEVLALLPTEVTAP